MSNWKRQAAMLGVPDLPEKAFQHVGDHKIKPQGGDGGGQTTSYTSNIPEWAQDSFMDLVGRSDALSKTAYQPYEGQRVAGFSPMQQQAQQTAAAQTVDPSTDAAAGLAGAASTASFTQPGVAQNYMSPYMQNVVDINKREAIRDADIAGTARAGQAVQAGAFGGSRQAIMDAEAGRNLSTQLGDIQSQGLQAAFESGQGQFNSEMARGLQGASTLGTLGQQRFGQEMDITQQQQTLGQSQQDLLQKGLDQQYNDFQAQQDRPYQQAGFLSDILRGVNGSTRTMYSQTPQASPLQTIAGLGTAASAFMAEGGEVPSGKKKKRRLSAGLTALAISKM
jgi:hypothetical protein